MESHVLNTYHPARYLSNGHSRPSESASESSCEQNSPEYRAKPALYGQYWEQDWSRTQTINMTKSQNCSSDEEEQIEVQELVYDDKDPEIEVIEEALVEGDDYDVIQVYAVDPDIDLEVSDDDCDDEERLDFNIPNNEDPSQKGIVLSKDDDVLSFNLDAPVVTNVDEYFIKEDKDRDILAVKDEPVVSDVDEYFIKKDKKASDVEKFFVNDSRTEAPKTVDINELRNINVEKFSVKNISLKKSKRVGVSNVLVKNITPEKSKRVIVEEFLVKNKTPRKSNLNDLFDYNKTPVKTKEVEVEDYAIKNKTLKKIKSDIFAKVKAPDLLKSVSVNDFLVANSEKPPNIVLENQEPVNESDLEVLPNIEDLKRFLLEDMTYCKFKNAQRSFSLPQSPIHNICLDIDDSKTCLSFEDLNLDLSDLTFDNDKDKSGSSKSDDIPRTLTDEDVNSFLITSKPDQQVSRTEDDLSHQDMEIERPVESNIGPIDTAVMKRTSTPEPQSTVLDFCIEKPAKVVLKKEKTNTKTDVDDFVDVESCNEVVPVLEANNLSSLLEQFEATEKLNTKPKPIAVNKEETKVKSVNLTNGMRLQDAGVQLNKNKMRQILMPPSINATIRRSPSPVHSDHDYCSSKKRFSLPNIKSGQSLLKPEVLSSNNKILNSRHRSCKSKKVVYNLSSDEETDRKGDKNKKVDVSDIKIKKPSVKPTVKVIHQSNSRKKLSLEQSANNIRDRSNISVIVQDACEASDTLCSQKCNGSIKLTIKNKSEVILNCDDKVSHKDKNIEKCKSSVIEKLNVDTQNNVKNKNIKEEKVKCIKIEKVKNIKEEKLKNTKDLGSNKKIISSVVDTNVSVKEEPCLKTEHFYTALFSNKQDVQIPQAIQIKSEKRSFEEEISIVTNILIKNEEQPVKKKKLNLQEYKLRKFVSSNNNSAAVSPEAIFPDLSIRFHTNKSTKYTPNRTTPYNLSSKTEQTNKEASNKIFDPIREASRKILMNSKKLKAEAMMRKREEDIVMSKIPKVDNLQLQPLISDDEMKKIVGMTSEALALPVVKEKPQTPAAYEEIVMVSVGVNTDNALFKELKKTIVINKPKSPTESKVHINFKIRKSEHILKQNVFDSEKRDKKSPVDDKKHETKIDKERYKDITATLKSVGRQVDKKICSNSLLASIQDVVLKKAPNEVTLKYPEKSSKSKSLKRIVVNMKTAIVRDYDTTTDHGEDKVILHLEKDRKKPSSSTMIIQTDPLPEYSAISTLEKSVFVRKRTESDMSVSSEGSPVRKKSPRKDNNIKKSKDKKPSKDRYKRNRSLDRSRSCLSRHRKSHSRSRSRSKFRRYRRSDSPYRRRSKSRYHKSPSPRRRKSRSMTKSPKKSPRREKSLTPPPRKPTVSESSLSSSSTSSTSSSSRASCSGRRSVSPRRDDTLYRRSFSSEDRENNTPVEERRIVFVGKLEKDLTKAGLRSQFTKFGPVIEVRLHSKEDGTRYGFVTFQRARDAWSAVEAASTFPRYDVGFGGRRAFCRQSYADLDGLEAKYTEIAFHGAPPAPAPRRVDMSFEQMLLEMKKTLSQRKDKKSDHA